MSRWYIQATWDDVPHLTKQQKKEFLDTVSPHERDARTKGIPTLGAGAIYPIAEEEVICDPFVIPAYYRHAYGMDVGWNRTAAVWGAHDPESDILYIYSEHYRAHAEPPIHAQAILSRGKWIPGVIDPASRGSDNNGERLLLLYQRLGLNLTEANNARETGILETWMRFSTGRLKIFRNCQSLLAEFRIYRRNEKGAIVDTSDHALDSLRYLVVSGVGRSVTRPYEEWNGRAPMIEKPKHIVDYEPFLEMYKR